MISPGQTDVPYTHLGGIVGPDHIWEAGPQDAVDGIQPAWVIEPGSIEEAAAVLRWANESDRSLILRGSGTKLDLGNIPERADLVLSMKRLNRVLEHASGDLVAIVEAGAMLQDVQAILARGGQRLALQSPDPTASIGGIVATDSSGPSRLRFGTVRDAAIGITYILPTGAIAKAGGRVVKNVAGYDLCKLFTGSLGTLGLIAVVTFRLHPIPEASRGVSLRIGRGSEDALGEAMGQVAHSTLTPSAMDFQWDTGGRLDLLFEGIEPGVVAQADIAAGLLRPFGEVEIDHLDGGSAVPDDLSHERSHLQEATVVKISTLPSRLPQVLTMLDGLSSVDALATHIWGHGGSGITYADITGETAAQRRAIEILRAAIPAPEGSVVVTQAPLRVKESLDVWGDAGDSLPLMRRVKEMFDPNRVLNPGRYIGGL